MLYLSDWQKLIMNNCYKGCGDMDILLSCHYGNQKGKLFWEENCQ